jgi:hypothetical protein
MGLPPAWYQPVSVGVFFRRGYRRDRTALAGALGVASLPFVSRSWRYASGKPEMSGLVIHLQNILRLVVKELRSLRADPIMLLAQWSIPSSPSTTVRHPLNEADSHHRIVDEDQSGVLALCSAPSARRCSRSRSASPPRRSTPR